MDHRIRALIAGSFLGTIVALALFSELPTVVAPPHSVACDSVYAAPLVVARAAYVYSVSDGKVLFEKNAQVQLPLASLTKVMTVLAALDTLEASDVVTISKDALTPDGESGFRVSDVLKAHDLAAFTLIESSNDGARALLLATNEKLGMPESGFIEGMNRRARGIGLSQTYYMNETGLDISTSTAGAYGSARDMALLMSYVATEKPSVIEHSVEPKRVLRVKGGADLVAKNTALMATAFGSAIGSKTGFTDLAGGNLAFVFEPIPGKPIAIAVLGSTVESREDDVTLLARYAEAYLKRQGACTL